MDFRKKWNAILTGKHLDKTIYGILGLLAGMAVFSIWKDKVPFLDIVKIVLTPTIIFTSLVLTAKQFAYNREWNKKDAANKALYASKSKINEYIDALSTHFNLRQMMRNNQIAKIQDIHNAMGVFVKSSNGTELYDFVYHSASPKQEDIRRVHEKIDSDYITEFDSSINGKDIERAILSLLGEYEYLCMSCKYEIFDHNAVIELIGPNIVTTFNTLSDYIMHLRIDSRHGGGRSHVYEYFESFSKDIVNYKNNKFNLKCAELTEVSERHKVPFKLTGS